MRAAAHHDSGACLVSLHLLLAYAVCHSQLQAHASTTAHAPTARSTAPASALYSNSCLPFGLLLSAKLRLPAIAPCKDGGAAEHGLLPPGPATAAFGSRPRYSCRLYAAKAAKEFKFVAPLHTNDTNWQIRQVEKGAVSDKLGLSGLRQLQHVARSALPAHLVKLLLDCCTAGTVLAACETLPDADTRLLLQVSESLWLGLSCAALQVYTSSNSSGSVSGTRLRAVTALARCCSSVCTAGEETCFNVKTCGHRLPWRPGVLLDSCAGAVLSCGWLLLCTASR